MNKKIADCARSKGWEVVMEVELTDVGKAWLQEHYPQGIVWEYDVDKPFKLQGWAAEFIELTCLGIPYRIPPDVDGKPTIRKLEMQVR